MAQPQGDESSQDTTDIWYYLKPLVAYRKVIAAGTLTLTAAAFLLGLYWYLTQPVSWMAYVGFAPAFAEAAEGKYPNDLPFAATDVVDKSVISEVFEKNRIDAYCGRDAFTSGFVVDMSSPALDFLEAEYSARLADKGLTAVDRDRLAAEFNAKRTALPLQYQLTWLRSEACSKVPAAVATKVLTEVLSGWADTSETKRGVLKLQTYVLTPNVFDAGGVAEGSVLIRADQLRTQIRRVINNITEVQLHPGADLVHVGDKQVSLMEVRSRLEDLVMVQVDPLVGIAGRGTPSDIHWVEYGLAQAQDRLKASEDLANSIQAALLVYSGGTVAPSTSGAAAERNRNPADVQSLAPQIDRTFIDRILEMSKANTDFRQELTRKMVQARQAAIREATDVQHYERLSRQVKSGASPAPAAEIEKKLKAIEAEARLQVKQFDELYDEFSRVSLWPAASMYRIERPTATASVRSYSLRSVGVLVMSTFFLSLVLLSVAAVVRHLTRRHGPALSASA
jgi:hypothetical protein